VILDGGRSAVIVAAWGSRTGASILGSSSRPSEESLSSLRALVFDAYGTLFDVYSVIALCEELWPEKGAALSQLWRAKQLEYTWQRSLMRRYEHFAAVTEAALRYSCTALGLPLDEERRRRLTDAYLTLATFPEVGNTLAKLKAMRLKLAILSNGSPAMLRPLVANAGLVGLIGTVISVDPRKIYKPAPAVYRLAVEKLRTPKAAIGFVSSNCWDACGAKSFGFRTFWINRGAAPVDELGAAPDHVIESLDELPDLLRGAIS
jgi:2-haloacid dehalogenase